MAAGPPELRRPRQPSGTGSDTQSPVADVSAARTTGAGGAELG